MSTKEKIVKAVSDLPEDASFEVAIDRLIFLAKIEKGLEQAAAGNTLSHEEVVKRFNTSCQS